MFLSIKNGYIDTLIYDAKVFIAFQISINYKDSKNKELQRKLKLTSFSHEGD